MNASDTGVRALETGRGTAWIAEGFGLFKKEPLLWIAVLVLWFVAMIVVSFVPLLGSLALNIATPVVLGGLMLGCKAQSEGQPFKIDYLWAGFKDPYLQPLLLLGVAYLLIGIVVGVVVVGVLVATVGMSFLSGGGDLSGIGIGGVLVFLILLALLVPVTMATWFAPALVVFQNKSPVAALKASFAGCLANIVPFLVYGLLALLISIVAAIPFLLGFLVAAPVFIASTYFGYRDIFGAPSEATPDVVS